jgi:isopenicillin-N N-acyltransferase-like protein
MLKLKRLDNMDILTNDVQRLVDFYHGTLGLGFFLPYVAEERWAAIEMGNVTLYLFHTTDSTPVERRTAVNLEDKQGFDSFAFEVENLDDAIAYLDGKVQWVTAKPIEWQHPNGTHYRYRPMFDPDGNMVYITQPHKTV